ncbi:MAG: hypothetical protein KDC54_07675, partial [Lewinella sp.]|nr:hypothetical protein [Lewinella sp.]
MRQLMFVLAFVVITLPLNAQSPWWQDAAEVPTVTSRSVRFSPTLFRFMRVDTLAVLDQLDAVPAEGAAGPVATLRLPRPEGGLEEFRLVSY